ncbi:MAG: pyruvate formate lyase-activating protein [Gammaproteobacteria bacterium]|nr:pyruvate formate lyase-activating protein [Gammaproteobacteria bacterium]
MTGQQVQQKVSLEAKSPFDMRIELGKDLPETDVRTALESGDMGFLHSFTTGSALDGPGMRAVAWTTGCMWRCLYCHNPDTWTLRNGIPVAVVKATEQLRKYRYGLKVMSGGFTISGGEPLLQDRFVVKMFQAAKGMGIHTALDTNGYYGERLSDAELDLADLVLLDLKAWDEEKHRHLTGREPGPTRVFAQRLAARRRPGWVRFVMVPGLTDDPDEVGQIARFAGSLGNVERVDVLPFHQLGRYKWDKLGIEYKLGNTEPPSAEAVEQVCSIFRAEGLKTY